jgi:hypothetical protein
MFARVHKEKAATPTRVCTLVCVYVCVFTALADMFVTAVHLTAGGCVSAHIVVDGEDGLASDGDTDRTIGRHLQPAYTVKSREQGAENREQGGESREHGVASSE